MEKNTNHYIRKSEKKNVMKPKKSGLVTSAETSSYAIELLRRQCTKTLKKPLENLLIHRMSEVKKR